MCNDANKVGDNMSAIIEEIIKRDREPIERFCAHQRARIEELQRIDKTNPSDEQVSEIVVRLQSTGILDEDGNLATPYNSGE